MSIKAIVLLSGGQDSTTCLFWAKRIFGKVLALNIYYSQRHAIEIESARKIAKLANVPYRFFETDLFRKVGNSALVDGGEVSDPHVIDKDLPASFVPGRNIIFLTIAAALAYKHQISSIVTGVCQTDSSGYPDCRQESITSLQQTLNRGFGSSRNGFCIHTPLMNKDKKEAVEMAKSLPGCMDALAYSHTCYEGQVPPCGKCPACKLREDGFSRAGVQDPLVRRLYFEGVKNNGGL